MSNTSRTSGTLKIEEDISTAESLERKRLNDLLKAKKGKEILNIMIKKGGKIDGIKLKKD
jgi:hypothetical protein